ncbi:hypothetical protein RRF57_011749 [Xylaria bambusicola]|uniref:Uncharacterized protein n=1 Tax=Xylaria bambusicola TaxID=326684 RepID=A0AAN7ZA78_9PEZI
MTTPRPTSSFYSDDFEFQGLLQRLSQVTWEQEIRTIHTLEEEKRYWQQQLFKGHDEWSSIYDAVQVRDVLVLMRRVLQENKIKGETERQKWMANSTVI